MQKLDAVDDAELYRQMCDRSISKRERDAAFAEIYRRYSPRLYAYCRRILGDESAAQDAFQETFVRFFTSAESARTMTNLPAYLLRIARNVCLNMKRSQHQTVELQEFHIVTRENPYENDELAELLAYALNLLSIEYREAFILHEYEGYSYAEISQMTGVSTDVVKIRAFRARQKLRRILAPYFSDRPEDTNTGP